MGKNMSRLTLVFMFGFILLLVACGEKSQESVMKKLESNYSALDGYKVQAEMNMKTGQEDQAYKIDVWHKKGGFFRVSLTNEEDEKSGQVILKNKDGVFVLTPALKKSFKFQTDWPENSSQPYLYQSLVNDVLKDKESEFKADDTHYIFLTKTNYQNSNNLPYQEVYFDKKSYIPTHVKVMDKEKNVRVEVVFSGFEKNPSFDSDAFDKEKNLKSTMSEEPVINEDEQEQDVMPVTYPLETLGAELVEKKEVPLEDGERVIMTFKGDKSFTLIQEKITTVPTQSQPKEVVGDIVNLGQNVGALSGNSLEWSDNGIDYYLASDELTKEELIEVAISVQGQEVK